jgi:hypothetical protein
MKRFAIGHVNREQSERCLMQCVLELLCCDENIISTEPEAAMKSLIVCDGGLLINTLNI